MSAPETLMALAAFGLAGLAVATFAALRGWSAWLDLKRVERSAALPTASPGGGKEIAELRKRVRKLEAIASGIEL